MVRSTAVGARRCSRGMWATRKSEIWYLNMQYTAQQALDMGLVNRVVPADELDAAVNEWTDILGERSPTALAFTKRSFNADSENIRGISLLALNSVKLFYDTEDRKSTRLNSSH